MKLLNYVFCCFLFCFITIIAFSQTIDTTAQESLLIPDYTSVHYRGTATININEQSNICQFNVVSVIDSFLYIQLNIAALEAGRMMITPENVRFINKLQRKFYDGDYSFFEKLLDMEIDFFTLQKIFNGGEPDFFDQEFELSFLKDSINFDYPFFNVLLFEYDSISLKLDVKKISFNVVPEVNATIPKNFTEIDNNDL